MSRISVYVRMRPVLQNQQKQESVKRRIGLNQLKNQINVELSQKSQKVFKFDGILGDQCTQNQVFDCIDMTGLVNRVVDGYHSTIFAYGQTGSGKTHTIEGESQEQQSMGLIPRSIKNLFQSIRSKQQASSGSGFKVYISFLQIYNQQIYDLIDVSKKALKMRWNKYQQFVVQNLFQGQCRNQKEALGWWKKGQKSKIVDSHQMNKQSSRSHCILTMRVKIFQLQDPSNCIESKLQIVDLAGSQRQKVTKSTGIVFRQGIQINKSLFSLRKVIAALYESNIGSKSQTLPPYRDSKLTCLLKQSIGGNAYCAMIACINPTLAHFQESLQTLTYASMATYINNVPLRNIDPKVRQNQLLKQQNYNLKEDIRNLSAHIEYVIGLLQNNTCQNCGFSNVIKSKDFDSKYTSKSIKRPQVQQSQNCKLAKFSSTNQSKLIKKITGNDSSFLAQTQQKQLKKRIQRQQVLQIQRTFKESGQYQLKNPKQILQSITMIRDLINTNTKLRDKIQMMKQQQQKLQRETYQIIQENQLLRDRWEMLGDNVKVTQQKQDQAPISLYERLLKQQKGQRNMYWMGKNNLKTAQVKGQTESTNLRSIQRQQNIEAIRRSQDLSPYRPYNQILRNRSKRNKETLVARKRNLSIINKQPDSFIY